MNRIIEPAREINVMARCDVLVAGGGVAGIAAALAAARTASFKSGSPGKAKVMLIERECLLGGLATLGLIAIYLPLCDGMGRQVSFGLAEELLRLSIKHGAQAQYPDAWLDPESGSSRKEQRFLVQYNPNLFALEAEKLLLNEGVEILYYTQICGALTEGDKITHIIVENKSGRSAVSAKTFVDATGDADICRLAGEDTVDFAQKNVLAAWYYHESGEGAKLRLLGASDIPDNERELSRAKPLIDKRFNGIDDVSEMVRLSHGKMLEDMLAGGGDAKPRVPTSLPVLPQVRMTRRIDGAGTMDDRDAHKPFCDSVGLISDWRKRGPVYEVSASALYGRRVANLIAAGRCISATDAMWDITRVIPACAVTGEAAGTAAAMFDRFPGMDAGALKTELSRKKVITKLSELRE